MTKHEAAAVLVEMCCATQNYFGGDIKFYEAVALACASLICDDEEVSDDE